ncbi:MAG: hypothetical protein JWQ74_564 [Marmoricola sp.]|nr:hypothetical protein [Marmoricola sp.]
MSDLNSRARSLPASAALGGAAAAGTTLAGCLSVALLGWFLADAGAHGETTDALRAGADAWLMGHGSRLVLTGLPLGVLPITVTMLLALGAFRSGRAAGRRAAPVSEDRTLASGVVSFAVVYVVAAAVVCVLATRSEATPGLARGILGALLVAVLAGGLGLAGGTGRLDVWLDQAPGWLREGVVGAVSGALVLLLAGAVLAAVSLVFSFNEAANVYSSLGLSAGDAFTYALLTALVAPNVALLGSSYLLGPGFAFGVGTTVSPTTVSLGAVPAFPVLAALPGQGPAPGWLVVVIGVPVLAGAAGAALGHRDGTSLPYDLAAIRGAAAGLGSGILVTVAIALAGGPLGTGRLAHIGAPIADVLVFATGTMAVGGLIGGSAQAWWQRRTERRG